MTDSVLFVADAGEQAGLGHISRSSAVAVALRCRGIDISCRGLGIEKPLERDGVTWTPLATPELPFQAGTVLVVDSYHIGDDALASAAESTRLVVMHDYGAVPARAALVVSTTSPRVQDRRGRLSGLTYAALRPAYWGLPVRDHRDGVARVLVTTGSGDVSGLGTSIVEAVGRALPETNVVLVRGPYGSVDVPTGIDVLDAPESLLEAMLSSELVIAGGGQTMLEAAAAGSPCIVLPLAANQRGQIVELAELGAVAVVDPPDVSQVVSTATRLVREPDARRAMSNKSQQAVDGYGALRIAFHIARLLND